MLSKDLEVTLNHAFKGARSKRHEFMTVEHLLLALLDNEAASNVLQACVPDLVKLRRQLAEFIDSTTPLIPEGDMDRETQPTLGFQRVLQRAVFHVQSSGKNEVTGANVLVAIFSEQESQAVYCLREQGVARIDVVNFVTHGISKINGHSEQHGHQEHSQDEERSGEEGSASDPLESYAANLNELARRDVSTRWLVACRKWSAFHRYLPVAARIIRCWLVNPAWAKRLLLKVWRA